MTHVNRFLAQTTLSQSAWLPQMSAKLDKSYANLEWVHDVQDRTFWCFLKPQGRPSYTEPLLADLHEVQDQICSLTNVREPGLSASVQWVVLASRTPGVFSLGGDLTVFAQKIQAGDSEGLRRYAYDCVEIGYRNATGYDGGAVTLGLAQGDALGGGFESLLSCDVLFAERSARFGLPEVLMNLFPGMGAHCFLTRRIGAAAATKLILSGDVFSAEAMHKLGIVDVLVEDGDGERAVRAYIDRHRSRQRAHAATYAASRLLGTVTLEHLRGIADIWVETAMALSEYDLRRMGHLVAAQDRSRRRHAPMSSVAAE